MQITQRHLAFLEEAKEIFSSNPRQETCWNSEKDLIALRYGADRDCINIFELGEEVGFFAQMMGKAPQLVLDSPKIPEFKPEPVMNIRSRRGDRVIFLNRNGHEHEPEEAREAGLEEGTSYTVDYTIVGQSHTVVALREFPGHEFNSVMFRGAYADV